MTTGIRDREPAFGDVVQAFSPRLGKAFGPEMLVVDVGPGVERGCVRCMYPYGLPASAMFEDDLPSTHLVVVRGWST